MKAVVKPTEPAHGLEITLIPNPFDETDTQDDYDIDQLVAELRKVGSFLINCPSGHVIEISNAWIDDSVTSQNPSQV